MEEQVKGLEVYLKKFNIPDENREEYGDSDVLGEYREWKDPEEVEFWTIVLIPMNKNLSFKTKYKKVKDNLLVILTEVVWEVTPGPNGLIFIYCKTVSPGQTEEYLFLYFVNSKKIMFSVALYFQTLKNSEYQELRKDIEQHLLDQPWKAKDGGPLNAFTLASRVNALIKGFDHIKMSLENKSQRMQPLSLTQDYSSHGGS